jgi:hypothetical protein
MIRGLSLALTGWRATHHLIQAIGRRLENLLAELASGKGHEQSMAR